MKNIKIFIALPVILLLGQIVFAQSPNNPLPDWVRTTQAARDRMERNNKDVSREMMNKMPRQPYPNAKRQTREEREAEERELKAAFEEINRKIAPPDAYLAAYADFLKEKNTGIARLLPDTNCDKGRVVTVKELERCSEMPVMTGSGSLYSTRLYEIPADTPLGYIYSLVGKSEIHFVGDKLIVGNGMTQAIISDIGEADLAGITLKSDAFKFLRDYKKAENKLDLALKADEIQKGFKSGGLFYSNSADVRPGSVYVMRSIAYWTEYKSFWNTDVFVALKIVGREKDGSIIFIWKKLKDKDAPQLTGD